MGVYENAQSHAEKRIAAYLILMKKPDQALVRHIVNSLKNMKDEQLKSFVVSHLNNIFTSEQQNMHQ